MRDLHGVDYQDGGRGNREQATSIYTSWGNAQVRGNNPEMSAG
jgi:hypothetical protein